MAEGVRRREGAVRDLAQLFLSLLCGQLAVHHPPIGVDDGRQITGALHPPLDLEGADARAAQRVEVGEHVQVFAVEDIGAARILFDGILSALIARAQAIAPAAGLHAGAAIGIAPVQVVTEQATPAV